MQDKNKILLGQANALSIRGATLAECIETNENKALFGKMNTTLSEIHLTVCVNSKKCLKCLDALADVVKKIGRSIKGTTSAFVKNCINGFYRNITYLRGLLSEHQSVRKHSYDIFDDDTDVSVFDQLFDYGLGGQHTCNMRC